MSFINATANISSRPTPNKVGADSAPTYSTVRITFDPYNHAQVQILLKKVYQDFGNDKNRWFYKSADPEQINNNCWVLDFVFKDPHDATMFGLKYMS